MKKKSYKYSSCADFETTVYTGQEYTEVWAAAIVDIGTEDVQIFHSMSEFFSYLDSRKGNLKIYFHNLKFDGNFIVDYILRNGYTVALENTDDDNVKWIDDSEMKENTFKCLISSMGQWYNIIIRQNKRFIEIQDSLKILPFSINRIGKAFGTKHKKLEMEYEGFRYAGCEITDKEKEYIGNDVLVAKEGIEIMIDEGHTKSTIGSCCLAEFKAGFYKNEYKNLFPNLYEMEYKGKTAGDYIKKSYRGGWCYLVKGKEGKHYNGITLDVNSLYPSMMSSQSGNIYPIGKPTFWEGNYIPEVAKRDDIFYFIRFNCRFKIKENKLPFVQIKNNLLYRSTEMLETSDIYNKKDGKYYSHYIDLDGNTALADVELTFTQMDFELFLEHYNVYDLVILDGCYFETTKGLFDSYMERYKKIKMVSKGAKRELAKLFLNNLYGKMASSQDSSFKWPYLKENGVVGFHIQKEKDKIPGYIPIGSAITSYARCFTIRAAQKNYYGKDKPGFIYADTDSIHCDIPLSEIKGVTLNETEFCCWKCEGEWDIAQFTRQKTYIEHICKEDGENVPPYYSIKCAGMPEKCKTLLNYSLCGTMINPDEENKKILDKMSEEEKEFVLVKRTLDDFNVGLSVPGKLLPTRMKGGIVLKPTSYEMHDI